MITGFVAVFAFHKCQTREFTILNSAVKVNNPLAHNKRKPPLSGSFSVILYFFAVLNPQP